MSSKRGTVAAPSSSPTASSVLGPASTRGNMTSKGSKAATQFLSARWKVMEAAASDTSLNASEKPEIHRDGKGAANNPTSLQGNNQQSKTGGGGNQGKSGSPWNRRH